MPLLNDTNKQLATLAGYEVFQAPEGQGFSWRVRDEKGNIAGQCDDEPLSEEGTWREVIGMTAEVCCQYEGLEISDWSDLSVEERRRLIALYHRDETSP